MNAPHTSNALLSSAFALLFAAALVLSGCSAGALTGPQAQPGPTPEAVAADVDGPQNNTGPQTNNEDGGGSTGGSTTPGAGHNTVDEE